MAALQLMRTDTMSTLPWNSAVSMLQDHLAHLCSDAASVCITDYEGQDPKALVALTERSRDLVAGALDALDVVSVLYCDGSSETPEIPETGDGDRPSSPPIDTENITDAVMLARMGLRARQRSLQALGDRATPWEQLSTVGGVLRTIQKSLSAVDRAMADAEQVPASINFYGRVVERSIEIRRRYVSFSKAVTQSGPPQPSELRRRLRLVGNSITQLLGLDIAVHLRTGDRALLMMMHSKVRQWLSHQEDDAVHLAAGQRLWQDALNAGTMFMDVNRREELTQHDARLVREALRELPPSGNAWDEAARLAMFGRLSAMLGRSPSLDALLQEPWANDKLEELRFTLLGLAQSLGGGFAASDEPPMSGTRPSAPDQESFHDLFS